MTSLRVIADKMKAINTPKMVTVCEAARLSKLPPKRVPKTPAKTDPAKGARGTANSMLAFNVVLMFDFFPISP